MIKLSGVAFASCLAVVACGSGRSTPPVTDGSSSGTSSSSSSSSTSSSSGAPSGTCKAYAPCEMLTQADVTAAIGAPVGVGSQFDSSFMSVETTQCNWTSATTPPTRDAAFLVRCATTHQALPLYSKDGLQHAYKNVVDVPGLGDAAFWGWDPLPASGDPGKPVAGTLAVLFGNDLLVIVGASGMTDQASGLAACQQLVREVLPKL
jgi:hypothetical protein